VAAHQGCGPRVGQQQRQPKGIAARPEKKQTTMGIGSRQHNPQLPIPPQKKIPPTGQFLPFFTPHSKTHKKVDGERRRQKVCGVPCQFFHYLSIGHFWLRQLPPGVFQSARIRHKKAYKKEGKKRWLHAVYAFLSTASPFGMLISSPLLFLSYSATDAIMQAQWQQHLSRNGAPDLAYIWLKPFTDKIWDTALHFRPRYTFPPPRPVKA